MNFQFKVKRIQKFLNEIGKDLSLEKFINFLKKGIQFREYSKFIFTKSIDYIFDKIKFLSKRNNVSLSKMSHLNIKLLKHLYYNLNYNDVMEILRKNINENMNEFNFNKFVELPRVIINPDDVFYLRKNQI